MIKVKLELFHVSTSRTVQAFIKHSLGFLFTNHSWNIVRKLIGFKSRSSAISDWPYQMDNTFRNCLIFKTNCSFNPLPDDKTLHWSKLKRIADDILKSIQNKKKKKKKKKKKIVAYRVENIVRKGEIACYKQFLIFSRCFPQLGYIIFIASKRGHCVVMD